MTATTVRVWPPTLTRSLTGLYGAIEASLDDCVVVPVSHIADVTTDEVSAADRSAAVIVLVESDSARASFHDEFRSMVARLRNSDGTDVVFVIGDGYLGTDTHDLSLSMFGASAVSAARSLALIKGRRGRSNVVCVPEAMLGGTGSQRGPISQRTETVDVVNAVVYLLGETGNYVSGQTLFVNGGRHLFSSQTA